MRFRGRDPWMKDMIDDKLETAIARGARAKELLESELMREVFRQIEEDYVAGWRNTSARDTDARERLWLAVQVLGVVKDHLVIVANDGKLAQAEVDRLTGLASSVDGLDVKAVVGPMNRIYAAHFWVA